MKNIKLLLLKIEPVFVALLCGYVLLCLTSFILGKFISDLFYAFILITGFTLAICLFGFSLIHICQCVNDKFSTWQDAEKEKLGLRNDRYDQ